MKLQDLLSKQAVLVKFEKYQNELQTMQSLQTLPPIIQSERRRLYLEFLNALEKPLNSTQSSEESEKWRESGNQAFKDKKENSLLNACQFYTLAIFKSPPPRLTDGKSETLSLAYANRALVMEKYGYFYQAYDDCELALEYGYPERIHHKIVARQANCMLKLKDKERLKKHIKHLEKMALNANFKKELEKLQAGWETLNQSDSIISKEPSNINESMSTQMGMKETIESNDASDRSMIAKQNIKQNELIFTERSTAFVPVGDNLLCQQCCSLLMVPYPCPFCLVQVVYCSLKCRNENSAIHAHECVGNQRDLFRHVGIVHLALRVVLTGLPQVVPFLAGQTDANGIWNNLIYDSNGVIKMLPVDYIQSLQMITHLDKMSDDDILWFALVAELLLIYLQEFTVFFDFTKHVKASKNDWELVTASLILRHVGQLIVNGHTSFSLVPQRSGKPYDPLYLPIFDTTIWSRPFHVKAGALHNFSDVEQVAAINLPYLSICNHACQSSFQCKFSGRYVSTYASRNIEQGEEIFNCYTLDYKKSMKTIRQGALKNTYKFDCHCSKCEREQPDEDYLQFHRYRCEKKNCQKIFVPEIDNLNCLIWWDNEEGLQRNEKLKCSACGATQLCEWFTEFNELLKSDAVATDRKELFECFDNLSEWLLEYHELKLMSAIQLVQDCFAAHFAGCKLTNFEFTKLVKIIRFYLNGMIAQGSQNSIEYVVKMTYLWDCIAMGKYECSKKEFAGMLQSIEFISEEFKQIFLNYFEDHIKPRLIK